MEPLITISIAAYNAEKYLQKCIDTMISCKMLDKMQIIVVNDGSKDLTQEIAKKNSIMFPDSIECVNKANGGHGSTINTSISLAKGKYFKIVDSDDWVETQNMDKLIEYLENATSDMVINPYYRVNAKTGNKTLISPFSKEPPKASIMSTIEELLTCEYKMAMHSVTFRTDLLKKVGPIIDNHCFYVDAEYTLFPIKYARTFTYLKFSIYDYLIGTQDQSVNMKNMIKRRQQHLTVCKRIIDYYHNNKDILTDSQEKIIVKRIEEFICYQYIILLNNNNKNEVAEFDRYLYDADLTLYKSSVSYGKKQLKSKYIYLLDRMRSKEFKNYFLLSKIIEAHRMLTSIKR